MWFLEVVLYLLDLYIIDYKQKISKLNYLRNKEIYLTNYLNNTLAEKVTFLQNEKGNDTLNIIYFLVCFAIIKLTF